jgi:hypothetical protein
MLGNQQFDQWPWREPAFFKGQGKIKLNGWTLNRSGQNGARCMLKSTNVKNWHKKEENIFVIMDTIIL